MNLKIGDIIRMTANENITGGVRLNYLEITQLL